MAMVAKFTNDEYTLSIAVSSGLEKVAKKEPATKTVGKATTTKKTTKKESK